MRVSLCINTFSTISSFFVKHSVPSWTCHCWSSACAYFYEMPNTPVRKYINPLTPIIYTVGALLAKQMNGELCIPKEASLLVSAPAYSVFMMDNVLSHCEIHLKRLLVTLQAEYVLLFSLWKAIQRETHCITAFLSSVDPVSTAARLNVTNCA